MRYSFKKSWAPAAFLAVSACGGADMEAYTAVHEKTKFSEDALYLAARDSVENIGLHLAIAETQTHTLETREKQVAISSIPRLSYKYSFHIETKGGVLTVEARCTRNSAVSENEFSDCGDDRPARVKKEQDLIVKRTLELAPSQQDKNADWSTFGQPHPEDDEPPKGDAKKDDSKDEATKDKAEKSGKTGKKAPDKSGDKASADKSSEGSKSKEASK